MTRTIATKTYPNSFGEQSAALLYCPPFMGMPGYFAVRAWDNWAHRTLADAKAHFRRIGGEA